MFRLFPRAAAMLAGFALTLYPAVRVNSKRNPAPTGAATAGAATRQVKKWMRALSLHDKAAQLVVMPFFGEPYNTRSAAFRQYRHLVMDEHVGGLIVLGHAIHGSVRNAEPYALAAFVNRMQRMSKIPLLVGADFERGAAFRVKDAAPWPHNMAFAAGNDLDGARYEGAATAREARALGIQWIFAPVADVNSNPQNPIINIRSYGEDPAQVSRLVRAYIEGAHSDAKFPVLVTAKHFPGHGNTSEDSHLGLARNLETREQLERIDLPPFREAIAAGVDAIMSAHMAVPSVETQEIPATVSAAILTGLLRDELKFQGLVVTDAMDMQGLTKFFDPPEASVRAVEAGADVLLMPRNAEEAIRGIVKAVQSGRISRKRLDDSVARILAAKARLGLAKKQALNPDQIAEVFDAPEDEARAQQVADKAITLVKDSKNLIPLKDPANACLSVLAEGRSSQEGRQLMEEFRGRAPNMKMQWLDPSMSPADLDQAAGALAGCKLNVVAAYVTIAEYRGNTALAGDFPVFLNKLMDGPAPVILVALGSPYVAASFPKVDAYLAAFSTVPVSETAAAKALFGEIAIGGTLPVTIPGFARYGDGVVLAAANTTSLKGAVPHD